MHVRNNLESYMNALHGYTYLGNVSTMKKNLKCGVILSVLEKLFQISSDTIVGANKSKS